MNEKEREKDVESCMQDSEKEKNVDLYDALLEISLNVFLCLLTVLHNILPLSLSKRCVRK